MADFPFGEPPFDIESVRDVSRPCYGTPASDVAKFQEYMIRQRRTAWWARQRFKVPARFGSDPSHSGYRDQPGGPLWCFTRHGRTVTQVDHGTLIYIGGEHEDSYDPDFCIYNDVVIENVNGEVEIVGFAKDDFPPTDFHTATIGMGNDLWLVGSLGYRDLRREGETQVYRFDCGSRTISSAIDTWGDGPGWISRHSARYVRRWQEVVVKGGQIWETRQGKLGLHPNAATFSLDLARGEWRRLTDAEAADA